ncbi:hypothetical protein E2562_037387 [Oryza meyeriana var. granulata]|uniref:Uncharacterized protein n=1 Tax=Oryza meyeriana var. granulata TaxID=110450 RepID=A0A6G1E7T4_9ORYZ|nr:hypothetical protein E2562_037387 [Oryza meyeriana var. granulata]
MVRASSWSSSSLRAFVASSLAATALTRSLLVTLLEVDLYGQGGTQLIELRPPIKGGLSELLHQVLGATQ